MGLKRILGASAVLLALAGLADAQQVVSRGGSFVQAQLLVGSASGGAERTAALVMQVKPGWKTYWRQPGEAGVPPQFDWSHSQNLASVEIGWPAPEVFDSFGYQTLGYGGRVVLPLTLTAAQAEAPIALALHARLGVCKDICVFEELELRAVLPVVGSSIHDGVIASAMDAMPMGAAEAGVALEACRIAGTGAARAVTARFSLPEGAGMPYIVAEGPEASWFEPPSVAEGETGEITFDSVLRLPAEDAWVDRSSIRFTLLTDEFATEIDGCIAEAG